jgi:thiosulfate dehydrogenase (quinone) large subunit
VGAFSAKTASEFAGTALPAGLVHAFLTVLPFAEFILGGLITLGLFTRWALTLGGLEITALIFGTALRSDWTTVSIQMIYAITYYLLLLHRADNEFSLDALFRIDRE